MIIDSTPIGPAKRSESAEALLPIYHAGPAGEPLLGLVKIARCFGVSAELIDLGTSTSAVEDLRISLTSGGSVWDLASLAKTILSADWMALASDLAASASNTLLLATKEEGGQSALLGVLSRGAVTEVCSAGQSNHVGFHSASRRWSAELAGHQYASSGCDALAMTLGEASNVEVIMTRGNVSPAFISLPCASSHVFIWCTRSVFDVDHPLGQELEFEQAAGEYVPAIIFLRAAFGERSWHSPAIAADIIIDDPVLSKRYGFVDFPKLLALARELCFHVTVAFIPWNYWRTRKKPLKLFLDHRDSFAICAHGCDHTKNEFRTRDYGDLLHRGHLAAERLDRHRERTGMEWDRLMVCPREDYSLEALQAFADSGRYLGLTNTACIPRDLSEKRVRGADLLLPAQDAFFGFPIFKRHYWTDISVFAMAVFLGKPAILVEHQDFFRDQHRALTAFVRQLGALSPSVRWSGLTDLACRTCRRRRLVSDAWEVQFFTDEFVTENPDPEPRIIRFLRRVSGSAVITSVTVNGSPVPYLRDGEFLSFAANLNGHAAASIRVGRSANSNGHGVPNSRIYEAKVATRRFLSELRDNWLARSPAVLKLANRLMQMMRLRSVK